MAINGRVNALISNGALINSNGAGSIYEVQTPSGVLYQVYVDGQTDVVFSKSTDGGISWTASVNVFTGTVVALSVWYDRWSGINADLIHMAYTESGGSDTLYRTIDAASSDALSTQTTIFAGNSSATGGHLSIARARGGNVYCKTCIDAGAEGGFFRLPNANVPNGAWDAARTINEALATTDQMILAPGFAADNQDMLAIWWDGSANQCSTYIYDDSANSWAERIWTGTFTDVAATTTYPHFALAVDLTNSKIIAVAWNAIDAANADLTCWSIDESADTALTDVVTNSTDDQGLAAISLDINTGYWTVFYSGKSDGSETIGTAVSLCRKVSNDAGSTWSDEMVLTDETVHIRGLWTCPRQYLGSVNAVYLADATNTDLIRCNAAITQPCAESLVGI